jgi:hypothetical protein
MMPQQCTQSIEYSSDHAIQLNNEGDLQLIAGRDEEAMALFSHALRVFKVVISRYARDGVCSPSPFELVHDRRVRLPRFDDSHAFLFNKAITLTLVTGCNAEDTQVYCSVIILNIALVHHCQGLLRGQDKLLVKAARFYETVIGLV